MVPRKIEPPLVGGDFLEGTVADFVRRCERYIGEIGSHASPDNALLAVLCDAVRLAREHCALATGQGGRGTIGIAKGPPLGFAVWNGKTGRELLLGGTEPWLVDAKRRAAENKSKLVMICEFEDPE